MSSPPSKRIKLEDSSKSEVYLKGDHSQADDSEHELEPEAEGEQCSICLQPHTDTTVIPACAHEFCFDCILIWSEQSRKCPLCSQPLGDHLIHNIRSKYDYQKYYLLPLKSSTGSPQPEANNSQRPSRPQQRPRRRPEANTFRRERREREETDRLDIAIANRRRIYDLNLYAKHTASNSFTKYKPFPSPTQFASSPDLIVRMTTFLRRELRVWVNLDVEFLTTFIISIMKSIDIRSESAVKLLAEFLDMGEEGSTDGSKRNAEHFAHEVYCYLRSPYKDLFVYDTIAQYDDPDHPYFTVVPSSTRENRWRPEEPPSAPQASSSHHRLSRSRSKSRDRSAGPSSRHVITGDASRGSYRRHRSYTRLSPRHRSRSLTWSPSGRQRSPSHADRPSQQSCFSDEVPDPQDSEGRSKIAKRAKGKERASDDHIEESREGSSPHDNPQGALPSTQIPLGNTTLQSERKREGKPSRSRNRNLLESVRAHLAIAPSKKQDVAGQANSRATRDSDLTSPSLLLHLFDPLSAVPSATSVTRDVVKELEPRNPSVDGPIAGPAPIAEHGLPDILTTTSRTRRPNPYGPSDHSLTQSQNTHVFAAVMSKTITYDLSLQNGAQQSNSTCSVEIKSNNFSQRGPDVETRLAMDGAEATLRRRARLNVRLTAEKRKSST